MSPISVILMGATGATGSKVLQELLQDSAVERVTTFTRRRLPEVDAASSSKLHQVVVPDFAELETATKVEDWQGEVIINALGTTRQIAGSGEQFVRIERDYSEMAMRMARRAGVQRSVTVSAQGANASVPAPLWFHPLLYTKTLGQKELAATTAGFAKCTIFQPGMLNRESSAASHGAVAAWLASAPFMNALPVSTLAKAVVRAAKDTTTGSSGVVVRITGNHAITSFAANL